MKFSSGVSSKTLLSSKKVWKYGRVVSALSSWTGSHLPGDLACHLSPLSADSESLGRVAGGSSSVFVESRGRVVTLDTCLDISASGSAMVLGARDLLSGVTPAASDSGCGCMTRWKHGVVHCGEMSGA